MVGPNNSVIVILYICGVVGVVVHAVMIIGIIIHRAMGLLIAAEFMPHLRTKEHVATQQCRRL